MARRVFITLTILSAIGAGISGLYLSNILATVVLLCLTILFLSLAAMEKTRESLS